MLKRTLLECLCFLGALGIILIYSKQSSTPPPSVQEATLHLMCVDSRKLDSVRNKLYTCSVHRNKDD